MRAPTQFLSETHLIGRRCKEHMLDTQHYPALRGSPFVWIGHSLLLPPYRMVRLSSVHSHIVACLSGRGRTLINGRAVDWEPGQVLLAPVDRHHAFEVAGREPWELAWVFLNDSPARPALPLKEPVLEHRDTKDFAMAVQMLSREASGAAEAAVMQALVTVLESSTRRLAGSEAVDIRLWRLWAQVESELGENWSNRRLSALASVSEEHLRRLCRQHYQESPMEHLTTLRMRRASMLLRASSEKIESIALQLGYGSVYSFSTAFKRWSGLPPATFRNRHAPIQKTVNH